MEELNLLKEIQKYGRAHPRKELERVENVKMLLLYRIFSNLYSVLLLTVTAFKKDKSSFYQLPIGIVLRCCYTDCLFALYLQRVSKEQAYEDLDLKKIEYAITLLERKEVYRDQVKSAGLEFDDSFIDHMWELEMEDNFLGSLTFDDNVAELTVTKQSKEQLKEAGFSKAKSIGTKDLTDFLTKIPELVAVVTRMYQYYKYFSLYEHFSENAQGDIASSLEKDGNDNIYFPSAIRALSAGVEKLIADK